LFCGSVSQANQTIGAEVGALGVTAYYWRYARHTKFNGFLDEPFKTVGVLGRRYSHMQLVALRAFFGAFDAKLAATRIGFSDAACVERSSTIGNEYLVAFAVAHHFYAVVALVGREYSVCIE
jgi:hypothetical protein